METGHRPNIVYRDGTFRAQRLNGVLGALMYGILLLNVILISLESVYELSHDHEKPKTDRSLHTFFAES